jgi:retinol dehydrogenase-12
VYPIREDLVAAAKLVEEGGKGHAKKFWEWNEEQVKQYL